MRGRGYQPKSATDKALKSILFWADRRTLDNLAELEAAEGKAGRRSHVIRQAIEEARKKLHEHDAAQDR